MFRLIFKVQNQTHKSLKTQKTSNFQNTKARAKMEKEKASVFRNLMISLFTLVSGQMINSKAVGFTC